MSLTVTMPQLGETVTEGTILSWAKNIGDSVVEDEVLVEISTDKVDTEMPSPASGVITEILVPFDKIVGRFVSKDIINEDTGAIYVEAGDELTWTVDKDGAVSGGRLKELLDAGIKLEQVRKVFAYLREHVATDIAAAHIVIDGGSVMLCDGDQLVDVLLAAERYEEALPGLRARADRSREDELRLLHVLQVTSDCDTNESIEILACSVNAQAKAGAH